MKGQVKLYETTAVIDIGDVDIVFCKPTNGRQDEITIEVMGADVARQVTISSKTLMGALKALEASHSRRNAQMERKEL